jgi:hypothetical protein
MNIGAEFVDCRMDLEAGFVYGYLWYASAHLEFLRYDRRIKQTLLPPTTFPS